MAKIKLNKNKLRQIINESVKKLLKEYYEYDGTERYDDYEDDGYKRIFLRDKYEKWCDTPQIPERIMTMVRHIAEKIGVDIGEEEVIELTNYYGVKIGIAKGFTLSHCTSSYADGPSEDYSEEFFSWLMGLGFKKGGSYGDNGLDSSTNWHDTYWHNEIYYGPSLVDEDVFYKWVQRDE